MGGWELEDQDADRDQTSSLPNSVKKIPVMSQCDAGNNSTLNDIKWHRTTLGAREGAPSKKIPSLTLTVGSLARNSWGAGSRWTVSRGSYSTTS